MVYHFLRLLYSQPQFITGCVSPSFAPIVEFLAPDIPFQHVEKARSN